ncbi:TPA: hypothetical protein ACYSC5_004041 [Klebsiella pneumoniae]|nr:hypothetical protein [Klebsiella pneumoniae]
MKLFPVVLFLCFLSSGCMTSSEYHKYLIDRIEEGKNKKDANILKENEEHQGGEFLCKTFGSEFKGLKPNSIVKVTDEVVRFKVYEQNNLVFTSPELSINTITKYRTASLEDENITASVFVGYREDSIGYRYEVNFESKIKDGSLYKVVYGTAHQILTPVYAGNITLSECRKI